MKLLCGGFRLGSGSGRASGVSAPSNYLRVFVGALGVANSEERVGDRVGKREFFLVWKVV